MKNHTSSKSVFLFVLIVVLISGCAGLGSNESAASAPKMTASGFECPAPEYPAEVTSTELNLFVWTEYISQDMQECFELVYGIKVNKAEYSSMDQMLEKLSEGGTGYDLIQPTDYAVSVLLRNGMLRELDREKLLVIKSFDVNYLDFEFDPGNKYTIPYLAGTDAIVVNTGKVNNIPQSWADLWDSEYANRMVFLDDSRSVIGLTLLSLGYDVNTTDAGQLAEARRQLKRLIPAIKLFDSDSPSNMLIEGQADLGMTWTGEAYIAKQENPKFEYIFPEEGVILWQDNWALLTDAPHADAAYAWLNYTNQGNVFWMVMRDWPYTNPNTASLEYAKDNPMKVLDRDGSETTLSAIYEAYMSSEITNVPPNVLRNGHRIADVGDATTLYNEIWADVRGQ
jgi:spermidine/putrescine-binding protein